MSEPTLERLSTGSVAFDRILGGGLPLRSLSMIAGEPGSGKTLFALQALFHLGREGKKGLYLTTLSEPALKLIQYMQQFSFFDERLVGKELFFADLGSVVRGRDADAVLKGIVSRVEQAEPAIVGLDDMLGGGVRRTSSTVIQEATGTGKALIGLQFLLDGARRGEPGIQFTLEETADQLRGIAQGFGWDLRELENRGLFSFRYVSPVELSTDAFLDRARQLIEQIGARRAVLDSLTSMGLGVASERRFKELVYAMTKHFRAQLVTLNLNMDIADLLGSAQLSGYGISFAADNVIQLKYVELEGKLERGISVLKARGVRHATDVRRMNFKENGIEVGEPFKGLRGVLTGLPIPVETKEP